MDNKETLNQHNTRINVNNEELASILITINKLPTVKEEKLQDKVVEPSTTEQTITADEEYSGLASVTVNAVTNEIDSNIVAENIKDGVEILGVTGTLQEGITPTGTLDITKNGEYDVTNYAGANVNIESTGADFEINDCSYLFYGNARLSVIDELLSLCKDVTDTQYMFYGCNTLKTLDLSNFDMSQVEDTKYMFQGCNILTSLNLDNWNTSKVQNMNYMFQNCTALKSINVNNLDTSSVTSMVGLFSSCRNLTSLDLSNWDMTKVTRTAQMFNYCYELMFIDIRNFTFASSQQDMFYGVPADCLIIVKDDTSKEWALKSRSDLTNIKTVAEYEAS